VIKQNDMDNTDVDKKIKVK